MACVFPYYYISCSCSDTRHTSTSKRLSRDVTVDEDLQDEEKTFDPRHPRSAFSLFPPENLLYCEECHDIKCPRCVTEEIICSYCPSCLFETPSSMMRSESNRCARNCFNCPVCTSQLVTAAIGQGRDAAYILNCNYCMWNTLEIGIRFDKPSNMRAQLDKIANGGQPRAPTRTDSVDILRKSSLAKEPFSTRDVNVNEAETEENDHSQPVDHTARFNAVKAFYKDQITSTSTNEPGIPSSALDLAYSSPSSLARIINIYSNIGNSSLKKSRQKPTIMREADLASEGFECIDTDLTHPGLIDFADTANISQRLFQYPAHLGNPVASGISQLRPIPALLRTKRAKRCAACKHILVKPEFKPSSTRYRIKLTAVNYIPFISWKPLPAPSGPLPTGPDGGDVILEPGKPSQWIMTLKNPLFENVKVSLGCPSATPGKHGHRVTILCPQFEIGKNGDIWDDALNSGSIGSMVSTQASSIVATGEQIAGKLYDKGRNWASVVVEIVPASILREQDTDLDEDEDVVEIPVRVRLEWKVTDGSVRTTDRTKSERATEEVGEIDDGSRELSYWMVLGVGRVSC